MIYVKNVDRLKRIKRLKREIELDKMVIINAKKRIESNREKLGVLQDE